MKNKENLHSFNTLFRTTFQESIDAFEWCKSVDLQRSIFNLKSNIFIFRGGDSEDWEISFSVIYSHESGEIVDAVYECDRYYRWSYKEHGLNSLGDFQGTTLEEYAKNNKNRYKEIQNNVTVCQELLKQILKSIKG